jgi:hypothetical protein
MKITINLLYDLILRAKKAARETHTSLAKYTADATRVALDKRRRRVLRREFKIVASGKGGLMPGVNLDNTSALLDIMDGIDKD